MHGHGVCVSELRNIRIKITCIRVLQGNIYIVVILSNFPFTNRKYVYAC